MKLIGAGLPRTATLSQKLALETLGYGPCYHMVNVLSNLSAADAWADMLAGGGDWERLFDGYEATVDWPGAFFYKDLMDAFPDAKVMLSVRDPEAWERSMINTIWGLFYGDNLARDLCTARARIDVPWRRYLELMLQMWEKSGLLPTDQAFQPGYMAQAMERYNNEVRQSVPADRLLVWSPADGWEPLCDFLDVEVPESELPRVNDSKAFNDMIITATLAALNEWQAKQVTPTSHP